MGAPGQGRAHQGADGGVHSGLHRVRDLRSILRRCGGVGWSPLSV